MASKLSKFALPLALVGGGATLLFLSRKAGAGEAMPDTKVSNDVIYGMVQNAIKGNLQGLTILADRADREAGTPTFTGQVARSAAQAAASGALPQKVVEANAVWTFMLNELLMKPGANKLFIPILERWLAQVQATSSLPKSVQMLTGKIQFLRNQ